MSAGPGTQAELIQRNQKGPDASQHSALFYLFQEVSKLASPIHSTFVGADSPGRWLRDASPPGSLEAEEEETCCLESSDHTGSPPHHCTSVEEQRPAGQPGLVGHSPWKVLSLINLQCQRLLHHSHAEEANSPPLAMDRVSQATAPCGPADGATTSTGVGSGPKEPNVSSLEGASQLHREDKKEEELSRNGASERSTEHLPRQNIPHTTEALSGASFLNSPLTHSSDTEALLCPRKPELTLDHNANLSLPFGAKRDPYSPPAPLPQPPPSTAHQWTGTQAAHPPEHGGAQQGVTATKPPRKQPRPSRSVDIHDPDLQGVMFRMDPELDASTDQCRLLITSQFR